MGQITAIRLISATSEQVFEIISQAHNFSKAVPHITNVEFLSSTKTGVGTRFRETRLMKGKESSTVLEVTEFTPNERIRLVSDQGGTIWDTLFTVEKHSDNQTKPGTKLEMIMDVTPYKIIAKIVTPFITGIVNKAVQKDMDSIKSYCEKHSTAL